MPAFWGVAEGLRPLVHLLLASTSAVISLGFRAQVFDSRVYSV